MNHQRNGLHPKLRIRTSLFQAIEFQDVVQSLQSTSSRSNHFRSRPSRSTRQQSSTHELYSDEVSLHRAESIHNDIASTTFSRFSFHPRYTLRKLFNKLFSTSSQRHIRRQVRKHLFPTLVGFRQKSMFSKISSVLSLPVIFSLAATLPVVRESALKSNTIELNDDINDLLQDYNEDEDEDQMQVTTDMVMQSEEGTWVKWLTAVQLFGGPLLVSFVLITQEIAPAFIVLPVILSISTSMSLAFWFTTSATKQPRLYWMMCFVGFAIAVVWIFLIANEVVSVLQAIGMALGVSEAILGLTVFALGNSLGDFVANVTMAKMGYPLMAMSACFGGPMLNIMLGVGIGATYVTSQRNEPYTIYVSKTIVVSSIGLLIVLISSLILVPFNGFRMSRGFGYSWIAIYLICTAINLYIEIQS
ncbi:hypothetical protein CU098_003020 [Rhizopus stolonifer]|uniref:Sodium/calcium exchanger membrane region domain-containing protein n=1 Tax=Rhizopus stolonifer TaxID=4846 RepID=A0A367IN61_RHIST|nr:hypothetical protein CU098_003020 [Rhizopus stolonifer]